MDVYNDKDIVAVIDIGSNEIRMKIAEKSKQNMSILENLRYPLNLAKDTFGLGSIGFDKANIICDVLLNFINVCREYGVAVIKTAATTAVREASNMEYILDQIRIKTGLDVKITDDISEKLYIFKLLDFYLNTNNVKESLLMSHIGSGSVGIGYGRCGAIPFIKSLKIGSLRISELFESMYGNSMEFYVMLEEFIDTFIGDSLLKPYGGIHNLAVLGNEASVIAELCMGEADGLLYYVDRSEFTRIYNKIKYQSPEMLISEYEMTHEKADSLLPTMCIYNSLLGFTDADRIIISTVGLADAIAFEYLFPGEFSEMDKNFSDSALMSAMEIAEKYKVLKSHYESILDISGKIFDRMKKVHGMGKRNKLLLQVASVLHDCGKFINVSDHHIHSFNIIKGCGIAGLTYDEIDIVANIALYHSQSLPNHSDSNYRELKSSKKVLVSKLTAILRLADALDRSSKQKLNDINVRLTESQLIVTASSAYNADLEKWAFYEKGKFYEGVFGIQPVLKIHKAV